MFVEFVTREIDPQRRYLGQITVLRLAVQQYHANSALPPPINYRDFQDVYHDLVERSVGGRTAAQFVTCGRAACHWQIALVVGLRGFRIFTMDPDEDAKSGPDNTRYPLVPMIESITFEPTPSR
jgi:hypothetical protein